MPRRITNFRIDEELLDALQRIKERDGLPIAEQVRRAIRKWVNSRGLKADRRRAETRRRS